MRRKCQECRLKKCLAVGMRPECVVPENQCAIKRKEKKAQKEKDKQFGGTTPVSTTNTFKTDILPQLMKCDPPPHAALAVSDVSSLRKSLHEQLIKCVYSFFQQQLLPEKLLQENRQRNIPQLTVNQMSVIYKLIWYQDGYEQPSEEDLKRIMIVSFWCSETLENELNFAFIYRVHPAKMRINMMFIFGI
jgi:ecdysone receptor